MYRLACYGEKEYDKPDIQYIREIASGTIARGLRYVYGSREQKGFFVSAILEVFSASGFFDGLARYVSMENDDKAGEEFVWRKVKRMTEKVEEQQQEHTFDVFEELLFYEAIIHCKDFYHFSQEENPLFYDREREKKVKTELMEKYHYSEKRAAKISRDITRFYEMDLKENQDENMFFWDDDYALVFRNGFLEGIQFLKSIAGENTGYGYDYAGEIFTDIGMRAPLLLLGTKEANRIANEVSWQKAREKLESVIPEVDYREEWDEEDWPFG